jgi:integrase
MVTVPGVGRRTHTAHSDREAKQWVRKAQADAASGRLVTKKPPTLATYLTQTWLPSIDDKVKSRTLASYSLNVRRIPAQLGARRLDELKPAHFQDYYNELTASGTAPRTVRQIHRTLHKALDDALCLDLVARNATEGVRLPRIPQTEQDWYTAEELARLFQATEDDRFHALWVVLGTLGLRLGEALGLKWDDIDWKRGTLTLQRKLERDRFGKGLILSELKTKGSRRTLTLTHKARTALQVHLDREEFIKRKTAAWQHTGLVFCTGHGTPLDQQRIHYNWTKACRRADLRRLRIHDLRHSWASIQLAGGVPVERLARMGGWSSVIMLYEVYGHIIAADFRDGASVMDAALAAASEARS